METVDPNENKYVAVAGRKSRNLRKKLNNILKIEAQKKEGKKPLNEEQLVLLTTRGTVEKALHDMEAMKAQLEELAREDAVNRMNELQSLRDELAAAKASSQTTEASTHTQSQDQSSNSTQYERVAPAEENHVACGPDNTAAEVVDHSAMFQEMMKSNIFKLLKLFHVCSRYSMLTGNDLPPDIVYFGKCLMGETSISGFKETLQQSARNAELYLDEDMGSKYEAIRGMSYIQIANIIDTLAGEFDRPPVVALESPPPQSPQINFFADEDVDVDGGVTLEDTARDLQQGVYGSNSFSSSSFPLPPSVGVDTAPWAGLNGMTLDSPTPPNSSPAPVSSGVSSDMDPVHVPEQSASGRKASAPGGSKGRGSGRGGGRGRGNGKGRGDGNAKAPAAEESSGAAPAVVSAPSAAVAAPPAEAPPAAPRGKAWGADSKAGGALAAVQAEPPATARPKTSGAPKKPAAAAGAPAAGNGGPAKKGPPRRAPAPNGGGRGPAGRGEGAKPAAGGAGRPRENRPPRTAPAAAPSK